MKLLAVAKSRRPSRATARSAGALEVLARRHVELRVTEPVADRAFVHQRQPRDVLATRRARRSAGLPCRSRARSRPRSRAARIRAAAGSARRGRRGLPGVRMNTLGYFGGGSGVPVFRVAVAVVDADADDLLGIGHGRQIADLVERDARLARGAELARARQQRPRAARRRASAPSAACRRRRCRRP